jgi:hypothetical protein
MTLSLHVPLLTWKSIAATEVAGSLDFFFLRLYYVCYMCSFSCIIYEYHSTAGSLKKKKGIYITCVVFVLFLCDEYVMHILRT